MARGDRFFYALKVHYFDLLDYIHDPEGDIYTSVLLTVCCSLLEKVLHHIRPDFY